MEDIPLILFCCPAYILAVVFGMSLVMAGKMADEVLERKAKENEQNKV